MDCSVASAVELAAQGRFEAGRQGASSPPSPKPVGSRASPVFIVQQRSDFASQSLESSFKVEKALARIIMSKFTRLYLRIPRPKSLFGLISLQTGTELISLALVFNKVTGVYGLLAILTGYQLSLLQLTTYIYSLAILAILIYLIPHIRKQSSFECLSLAWLYVIDTTVTCAYTAAFGVDWYFANAAIAVSESQPSSLPDIVAEGVKGIRQEAAVHGAAVPQETAASMVFIIGLTLIRVYFSLVVMAYAQQVLQKYMQLMILEGPGVDDNVGPFAADLPDGDGRRGQLGRLMVSLGRGYWMDYSETEDWTGGHSRKPSSVGTLAGEV